MNKKIISMVNFALCSVKCFAMVCSIVWNQHVKIIAEADDFTCVYVIYFDSFGYLLGI